MNKHPIMDRSLKNPTLGLAGLLAISLVLPVQARTHYRILDLGTLSGSSGSFVNTWGGGPVINNRGHVAGYANNSEYSNAFTDDCAFLWTEPGEVEMLPGLPGRTMTMAFALNDRDQVVGWSGFGYNPCHGVLWENGVTYELEAPTDIYNSYGPISINNHGTIVGVAATPGYSLISGLVWYDGHVQILPPLVSDDILTQANDINDHGQVAGASGLNWWSDYHAVLWDHGKITDLGTLGGLASYANALNNSGEIVGQAQVASGDWHCTLWQNGLITDLGNFGSDSYGLATDINDREEIVGYSGQIPYDFSIAHALLWQDGTIVDLQTLIPNDSGWVLKYAASINDCGQIAGWGLHNGQFRAFLLIPSEDKKDHKAEAKENDR